MKIKQINNLEIFHNEVYGYGVRRLDGVCLQDRMTLEQAEKFCRETLDFVSKRPFSRSALKKCLADKYNDRGCNLHTVWVYDIPDFGVIEIDCNHDVVGDEKYYLAGFNGGHGEGCDTIWYPSLVAARNEIVRMVNHKVTRVVNGSDLFDCELCRCHYSVADVKYNDPRIKDHACHSAKKQFANARV